MELKQAILLLLAFFCSQAQASDAVIVFAAPNDSSMPMAAFRDGVIEGGLLKDMGEAIGAELHRDTFFISLSRKRLDEALSRGEVDGICNYVPEWIGVSLNWSQGLIPDEDLLLVNPELPAPKTLTDVEGKTIGLVLGYTYPELDAVLGKNYKRDDAPSLPLNIKKLLMGRVSYAVVNRLSLNYHARQNPQLLSYATLPISAVNLRCGFSMASKIPFVEIDKAIHNLVKDGQIERLMAAYRK